MKEKIIVATLTYITFIVALSLITTFTGTLEPFEYVLGLFLVSLFAVPLIFVYGLIVSFISDAVLKNFNGAIRIVLAGSIHIVCAAASFFLINLFFDRDVNLFYQFHLFWEKSSRLVYISAACGALFWLYDELFKRKMMMKRSTANW